MTAAVFTVHRTAVTFTLPAGTGAACIGDSGCGGGDDGERDRRVKDHAKQAYTLRTEGCTRCGRVYTLTRRLAAGESTGGFCLIVSGQRPLTPVLDTLHHRMGRHGGTMPPMVERFITSLLDPAWDFPARVDADAQEAAEWAFAGWTPQGMALGRAAGMSSGEAFQWRLSARVIDETALGWREALAGAPDPWEEAGLWRELGVNDPADRPSGLVAADVAFLRALGKSHEPRWAPHGRKACPSVIALGVLDDKPPEATFALADAFFAEPTSPDDECWHASGGPREDYDCGWSLAASLRAREWIGGLPAGEAWQDLSWDALAVCLRAGLGPDEAVQFVRAGRDLDPLRVIAALR